jgi:L-alanine-DL-glutamate epimerase-like enolase superfamily enzyme
MAQGYRAYKLHSAVPGRIDDPADQTLQTVAAIRRAAGDGVKLLVDVNGAYSVHHAIEIGRRLEDLGVAVFECPVRETDHAALAQVADALTIAVAAGESHFTARAFLALAQDGRPDILQPDVVKAGGLTELLKIATIAQVAASSRPIMVHNTQPTLCTAAHLHYCATLPNSPYEHEYNIEPVSIRDQWSILPGQLAVQDGAIAVPDRPGLGVEVDEPLVRQLAERYDVQPGY